MMKDNDLELFFKAFARDRKVLGEDLTIGIYEDIFSYFMGKPVTGLEEVSNLIDEDGKLNLGYSEEDLLSEGIIDTIKNFFSNAKESIKGLLPDWFNKGQVIKAADALDAATGTAAGTKALSLADKAINKAQGFKRWLISAKDKIKTFFKGENISRLLNNGVTWFTNPANAAKVLGGAGGIVLLTIIIKSLKKRHQLNKYKNLQKIYDDNMNVKESAEEPSKAYSEIIKECQTNEKLYKLMFTEEFLNEEYHSNYMNY